MAASHLWDAVLMPTLLLAVFPFASLVFFLSPFYQGLTSITSSGILPQELANSIYFLILGIITSATISAFVERYKPYGSIKSKKFQETTSRTIMKLYKVLNIILFSEIATVVLVTIFVYSNPQIYSTIVLSSEAYQALVSILGVQTSNVLILMLGFNIPFLIYIYAILSFLFSVYLKRDFQFGLALKCIGEAAKEKKDQDERISRLIDGLSSYNKYLKRNFDLQFNDTRVCSNIICSSSDKNTIVDTIEKSFTDKSGDKLKPANCLSTFANLEPTEQFLIDKPLTTRIKEIVTLLVAIIPILITVIQVAFPQFLPKPSG